MQELGVRGVELAPTAVWPSPLDVTDVEVRAYRAAWNERGVQVVALQSLLYGRPELTIFESAARRVETLCYLRGIMRLGSLLGARPLVFGSPRNRRRSGVSAGRAEAVAVRFFREAASAAAELGVVLCIEPNPPAYECDFVTTADEAIELAAMVDSPGFGVHLDTGAAALGGEDIGAVLARCPTPPAHFHASEPFLAPLGEGGVDHARVAAELRSRGYPNWVSLEMRRPPGSDIAAELRRVLTLLVRAYGDGRD